MFTGHGKYIIELDEKTYWCAENRLETIGSLKEVTEEGQKWLVSDFENAVSRTMTIETPPKYAEVIARKKMEESGEFDEPISIVTHWKKKTDKDSTRIFFTALPTRLYQRHFESTEYHSDSVLVFPLYTILYGLLKRVARSRPVAVVFQHGRFADILIGTKQTVYYANRCAAFDDTKEQISALWETVQSDITSVELENKIEIEDILLVDWVDSKQEPELPDALKDRFSFIEKKPMVFNGKTYRASFFTAIQMQSSFNSASSAPEKFLFFSQLSLPWLNAILVLAVLLCSGGYWWFSHQTAAMAMETDALQRRAQALRAQTASPQAPYKEVLSFVRNLERYRQTPSLKAVLNDLSGALSNMMSVEILKIDYGEDKVTIEVFGRTQATFDQAHKGYLRFLGLLQQNGYAVVESTFDTKIENSTFLTRLTRNI